MDQPIRISAEVQQHDPGACKFTLERPIYRGFIRFRDSAKAKGSPLIERLFALDGVTGVALNDNTVTVYHTRPVDWRAFGPSVGAALRAHLQSGQPPVSDEATKNTSVEDVLRMKVQKILDEQINPAIASHGGVIALIDVKDKDLYIQMGGGCQGCGHADVTLRGGVETALRDQVPEIGQIFDISDHEAGENPYYSSSRDTGR